MAGTATIMNYTNGDPMTAGSGGGDPTTGVLRFAGTNADDFKGDVTLTNIDIFNNVGFALDFDNVGSESAVTITSGNGLTYDGGAGAAGGLRFDAFDGTFTGNSSTLENGTMAGVRIIGNSDGTFTFANTFTIDSVDNATGAAFDINGFTGALTMNGTINNDVGRSVSVQNMSLAGTTVTFGATADITHNTTACEFRRRLYTRATPTARSRLPAT